jgi:hypothetical protein
MADPACDVAPLGEGLGDSHPRGDRGEDLVVGAPLAHGLDGLAHGHDQRLPGRHRDVLALERCRSRELDVGMARHRGPADVVDDDRLGPVQRAHEAADILMVVEGVAARPVEKPGIRVEPGFGSASAIRATGIASPTGFSRCGRAGDRKGCSGLPIPFTEA